MSVLTVHRICCLTVPSTFRTCRSYLRALTTPKATQPAPLNNRDSRYITPSRELIGLHFRRDKLAPLTDCFRIVTTDTNGHIDSNVTSRSYPLTESLPRPIFNQLKSNGNVIFLCIMTSHSPSRRYNGAPGKGWMDFNLQL
jgi:hypothetical protein